MDSLRWLFGFQSTPPAWGATFNAKLQDLQDYVSIHAPRVGGDPCMMCAGLVRLVSIHAPRVGGDWPLGLPCARD